MNIGRIVAVNLECMASALRGKNLPTLKKALVYVPGKTVKEEKPNIN